MTQKKRDSFEIAVGNCINALRKAGYRDDAEEIQLFADTGETVIGVTNSISAMVEYGLPVKLADAQLAYLLAKDEGWDADMKNAEKAICAVRKRVTAK
jgi:hypothetical protein